MYNAVGLDIPKCMTCFPTAVIRIVKRAYVSVVGSLIAVASFKASSRVTFRLSHICRTTSLFRRNELSGSFHIPFRDPGELLSLLVSFSCRFSYLLLFLFYLCDDHTKNRFVYHHKYALCRYAGRNVRRLGKNIQNTVFEKL